MNICVIGLRGIPDVSGGIETHCEHLIPRLVELRPNWNFHLVGRTAYIGNTSYTYRGIKVHPATSVPHPYLETISNSIVAVFKARWHYDCDVVHIHAIGPGLVAPLARLLGLKVILTHHGDDFNRAKWNVIAKVALRLGEWVGVKAANVVIAVSPSGARRLREQYPDRADRVFHIPNGADHLTNSLTGNGAQVLQAYGLRRGSFNVSVGRLVPEKRFDDLIAAHERSGTNVPLVIVGGGEADYTSRLREQAGPNVIFTGTVNRETVAALVANARLFILASAHEGLPIAALEASALGAPVLLSDIVPNKDLGLPERNYFQLGNVETLAVRLVEDPQALKANALIEEFRWNNVAADTVKVFDSLI